MIHERVSAGKLASVRILLYLALAGYALSVPGERLALLPSGFHQGVGVSELLPAVLFTQSGTLALRLLSALLLLLAAAGVRPFRPFAVLGMLAFTVYLAMLHPGHREIGALYLGYALALGPSAESLCVMKPRPATTGGKPELFALTLQVATFAFLLTYSLIGVQRLLESAPAVFGDDSMVWHIASSSERNGSFRFAYGYRMLEAFPVSRPLLAAGFLVATFLEALAPLALFFRGFRRVFALFALGFHLSNLLLLNIEFTLNVLVVGLLLVDWELPARFREPASSAKGAFQA